MERKGELKKKALTLNSQILVLNCQKCENRLNETGDETCLYSLRLSEIALTEQEKVVKNSVPFDYTSCVLLRFGGENYKYSLFDCSLHFLPDTKY